MNFEKSFNQFSSFKTIIPFLIRPSQDVYVLAVLDFQMPCLRPGNPDLYLRNLPANYKCPGQKLGRPQRLWGRERMLQRSRTARMSTSSGALILIQINLIMETQVVSKYSVVKRTKVKGLCSWLNRGFVRVYSCSIVFVVFSKCKSGNRDK